MRTATVKASSLLADLSSRVAEPYSLLANLYSLLADLGLGRHQCLYWWRPWWRVGWGSHEAELLCQLA